MKVAAIVAMAIFESVKWRTLLLTTRKHYHKKPMLFEIRRKQFHFYKFEIIADW